MAGYKLSKQSAKKFKILLQKATGGDSQEVVGRGSPRYDCHVKITGDEVGGLWPCIPCYYDPEALVWVEFDEQRAKASNDGTLEVGRRYRALHYGENANEDMVFGVDERGDTVLLEAGCGVYISEYTDEDGNLVYVVEVDLEDVAGTHLTVEYPEGSGSGSGYDCGKLAVDVPSLLGCGTKLQPADEETGEPDKIAVDVAAISGDGTEVQEAESGEECDKLKAKAGCHTEVDADGIHVTPDTLAGDGIEAVSDGDCDYLQAYLDPCTLDFDEDGRIRVKFTDIVFDGLYWNPDICALGIHLECGLQYVGTSGIGLDYEVFGDGFEIVDESGSGCETVEVKPGCNVTVDDDGVSVDLPSIAGDGLEVVDDDPGYDCPYINAKLGDCLIFDEDGAITLDPTVTDTFTKEVAGEPFLTGGGCSVGISTPITTYEYGLNACGYVVSITDLGTVVRAGNTVSTNCCCSSSSSSSGPCQGTDSWYCTTLGCVQINSCDYPDGYTVVSGPHAGPLSCGECTINPSSSSSPQPCSYPGYSGPGYYCVSGVGCVHFASCEAASGTILSGPYPGSDCSGNCGSPPSCPGSCGWEWNGSSWDFTGYVGCDVGCGCTSYPDTPGGFIGQTAFTPCGGGIIPGPGGGGSSGLSSALPSMALYLSGQEAEERVYRAMSTTVKNPPKPKLLYPAVNYVISLPKRTDRRKQVEEQFKKAGLEYNLVDAFDGEQCVVPDTWVAPKAAWGCRLSHMAVLDEAWLKGLEVVAVYEDDVVLVEDFNVKLNDLIRDVTAVDENWQGIMIGGQHTKRNPIETSNPNVLHCQDCRRTHAYLVRAPYIKALYNTFRDNQHEHIDWAFGKRQPGDRVYCGREFLAFQGAGRSDITGRIRGQRAWQPKKITPRPVESKKGCGCKKGVE